MSLHTGRAWTAVVGIAVGAALGWVIADEGGPPVEKSASAELRALYEADQADRSHVTPPTPEQWREITARDKIRRDRVLELVRSAALQSGDDYFHAAMVLQHGEGSEDVLVAHVLATVAGFKGHEKGRWLSAAALDRYLHRTDRAQILGTQYVRSSPDVPWSQGEYVQWLPDAIRAEFGVPPLEEQTARVDRLNGKVDPAGDRE